MLGLIIMIIILFLLCVLVGIEKVSSAHEAKKHASRTKPMDEKEMYY